MNAPIFKKKNVRGKRRTRPELELEDPSNVSTFGAVKKLESPSSKALKWARYASLKDTEYLDKEPQEGLENSDGLDVNREEQAAEITASLVEQLGEDLPQIEILDNQSRMDAIPSGENNNMAYKTLTPENIDEALQSNRVRSKTFTLKELYFRDSPLETVSIEAEYADAYGNVSDEDMNRTKNQPEPEEPFEDDVMLDDYSKPTLSRHNDFYDLEVSIESDDLDMKTNKLPSSEKVREGILSRIERLEISLKMRSERASTLEQSLEESQRKRIGILKRLEAL